MRIRKEYKKHCEVFTIVTQSLSPSCSQGDITYHANSVHSADELVDELLSVSESTEALSEGVSLDLESTEWGGELEWPQEVVGLLEVWSAGNNLVDEVLNAGDTELTEGVLDNGVISEWDSAVVDLTVSSLVDQFSNCLS